MIPCSHMESYWNGQNIVRKYPTKDIIGEPFLYQPYLTCIMHNPYGNWPVPHGFCYMDPCSHMECYLNGQNILRKYLKKDILGEPFLCQPYQTCTMHNPYGKLPVSTWFLLNDSMLTNGILLKWSKYLNKISKQKIF